MNKRRKKIIRAAMVTTSNGSITQQKLQQQLPNDLVFGLLMKLEKVKNLHKYKCVSKSWCSIISSPQFPASYRSFHRGGLLISIPERIAGLRQLSFYYSSVLVEEQPVEPFFCSFKMPVSKFFGGIAEVINGITCVFYQNVVFVCNVCSGEKMILPDPVFRDHNSVNTSTKLFLGYDASNSGVYKLLKLRKVERQGTDFDELEAEILTLGCGSCSRREVLQPVAGIVVDGIFSTGYLLVKGVMYWIVNCLDNQPRLVSFDFKKDRFDLIQPPPDYKFLVHPKEWQFVQFKGHLGLLNSDYVCFGVHLLDHDGNEAKCWIKQYIPWPLGSDSEERTAVFVGNLPTGQILFSNLKLLDQKKSKSACVPIYSYDHQKNRFERLLVGSPPQIRHATNFGVGVTFLEENLAPLDFLLSEGH
ncbi:putative F-box protein At1g53550 [Coffea arabica]|uniref:F-box protein At1g53550 n=1 Tax=Coffea arabica TaxID=13443 RepID=A0ABM4UAH3_COFAR